MGRGREARIEADPVALYNRRLFRGFWLFARRMLRKNFHGVRLLKGHAPLPTDRPLIVYSNHPSWWDPLFILALRVHLLPNHRGYGPIESAMLESYSVFRYLGLFGVEPTREGARRFLEVGERVLAQPGSVLGVTAQGRFADARDRPVTIMPGVAHLAARAPEAVLVPLALEYPFWDERYPEALAALGAPLRAEPGEGPRVLRARLEDALTTTMDGLAEAALARDPEPFEPVLAGSVGIGGVIDLGRRVEAWVKGRRFSASHRRDS